jgi:hypothetical protein
MTTMRSGFQSPSIRVGRTPLSYVFSRMLCHKRRDFSDVFFETAKVIHRQVEHQYAFIPYLMNWRQT